MVGLIVALVVIEIVLILSIIALIVDITIKNHFHIILKSIFVITCIVIEIIIISEIKNVQPEPTAIELEITSVNGVPQDTVVIFKK